MVAFSLGSPACFGLAYCWQFGGITQEKPLSTATLSFCPWISLLRSSLCSFRLMLFSGRICGASVMWNRQMKCLFVFHSNFQMVGSQANRLCFVLSGCPHRLSYSSFATSLPCQLLGINRCGCFHSETGNNAFLVCSPSVYICGSQIQCASWPQN